MCIDKNAFRVKVKKTRSETENREKKDAETITVFTDYFDKNNQFDKYLLYYPLKDEINILPLFDFLQKKNIPIYIPVSEKASYNLTFYKYDRKSLIKGSYGILEPDRKKCEELTSFEDAAIIVPNLCCDKNFNRMGYGKGFYDRFLSGKDIFKIALVYEELLFDKIPVSEYDIKMDMIITEKTKAMPLESTAKEIIF